MEGPQPRLPGQLVSDGGLGEGLCPEDPVASRHSWLLESPPNPNHSHLFPLLPALQPVGRGLGGNPGAAPQRSGMRGWKVGQRAGVSVDGKW